MSCVADANATTTAAMPMAVSPPSGPTIAIANKPPPTTSWENIIQPRRRPRSLPSTGTSPRSTIGAHKILNEYARPTQLRKPMAVRLVPASRNQKPKVLPVSKKGSPAAKPRATITATLGWRSSANTSSAVRFLGFGGVDVDVAAADEGAGAVMAAHIGLSSELRKERANVTREKRAATACSA